MNKSVLDHTLQVGWLIDPESVGKFFYAFCFGWVWPQSGYDVVMTDMDRRKSFPAYSIGDAGDLVVNDSFDDFAGADFQSLCRFGNMLPTMLCLPQLCCTGQNLIEELLAIGWIPDGAAFGHQLVQERD
ncbi:hypothetical protein [uncultured Pelagimonas sp.]|uniref:hypothetical protein n=1 Tax=uncultured Pelagimonas sp. TaxID=1618102 RepID=UPI0026370FCB|nr:hypothetical protein [uncultured Pelagimonas sp.]